VLRVIAMNIQWMSRNTARRETTIEPAYASGSHGKITWLFVLLIAFTALTWAWAGLASQAHPLLMGTAVLAYTLGLRHAADADHIAAIDNATRKLMQNGQRPIAVGLFFSLGHCSVVFLATLALVSSTFIMDGRLFDLSRFGAGFGSGLSAAFLLAIALANLLIVIGSFDDFRRIRTGRALVEENLDAMLANFGLLARLLGPVFKLIRNSWHMFPIGFLFGLGFDTAAEIGVLGLAATSAEQSLPILSILLFPALFTAGMTLVDTADGVLMLGVYGWGRAKPIRRIYYNLAMTSISVVVALFVGSVEMLGVIGNQLKLDQGFWGAIATLNADFGALGFVVIAVFIASWSVAAAIYVVNGYDRVDVTWTPSNENARRA
jgi:high-affinity nickel-transport protein